MNLFKKLRLYHERQSLSKINPFRTPKFNLHQKLYVAKVIKIIDCDTIVCIFKPFFFEKYYQFTLRLLHFHASIIQTLDPQKKEKQLLIKSYLTNILEKVDYIYVLCNEFDCAGRIIAHVFLDTRQKECVNQKIDELYFL